MNLDSYHAKRFLKLGLFIFACFIAISSLWYTNDLVNQLKKEEERKARKWAEATNIIANRATEENFDMTFALSIVRDNNTIPVIVVLDGVITDYRNLDSLRIQEEGYLEHKVKEMGKQNEPIIVDFGKDKELKIYYENSILLTKLRYYPYVQLSVIAVFLAISYFALSYSRRSEQNQVWVGMSKETAHQLGTPISSLVAWLQLAEEGGDKLDEAIINEMRIDVDRLYLIADRFSKIGSSPVLEKENLVKVVRDTVGYLMKRAPKTVKFVLPDPDQVAIAHLNAPLFAWVIENLTKNAMDAMNGKGTISYEIIDREKEVVFDVSDTGTGIPSSRFKEIFKPGYTTKKRGWGLGLSLVRRIISNYHKGQIFVKESMPGKRTTFRIILRK